jgi:hypothetical protein
MLERLNGLKVVIAKQSEFLILPVMSMELNLVMRKPLDE